MILGPMRKCEDCGEFFKRPPDTRKKQIWQCPECRENPEREGPANPARSTWIGYERAGGKRV